MTDRITSNEANAYTDAIDAERDKDAIYCIGGIGSLVHMTSESLLAYIGDSLGEFVSDYDLAGIETEFRAALDAALPEEVSLAETELYGTWGRRDEYAETDWQAIWDSVDFWAIAARHDRGAAATD